MGSRPPRAARKPAGTRVILKRSSTKLDIEIPPSGFTGNSVALGGFAIFWNAFVAIWTTAALAGGGVLFALFSTPFWFAGAALIKQAVGKSLMRERLAIGKNKFRLSQVSGGL